MASTDTQDEQDLDTPFTIRSLINRAGTGENGQKLIDAVASFYPPELQAIQQRRPNPVLTENLDYEAVGRIAGLDIEDAVVRGGEGRQPAWVSYAAYDANGDTVKGGFPYEDLGQSSSDRHVSQRDQLEGSDAAAAHRRAEAKRAAAESGEVAEMRATIAELKARLDEAPDTGAELPPTDPLPVDQYDQATAKNIAVMLGAAPRETAQRVLAYEQAHEDRKGVKDAAVKRIADLDEEEQAERERVAALEAENAELRAQLDAATAPRE